jgi:hypothetical protein
MQTNIPCTYTGNVHCMLQQTYMCVSFVCTKVSEGMGWTGSQVRHGKQDTSAPSATAASSAAVAPSAAPAASSATGAASPKPNAPSAAAAAAPSK